MLDLKYIYAGHTVLFLYGRTKFERMTLLATVEAILFEPFQCYTTTTTTPVILP